MFAFSWSRALDGYEIVEDTDWRSIRPKNPAGRSETYDPWRLGDDRRVLFYRLAQTPGNESAYLKFANTYGLLLGKDPEPLDVWSSNIGMLRQAVCGWETGEIDDVIATFGGWDRHAFGQVSIALVQEPDQSRPQLRICPRTLYDALWIQFGQAVSADLKIKICPWCSSPFPYGPYTGHRSTAVYCSPQCQKAQAYRRKLEEQQ